MHPPLSSLKRKPDRRGAARQACSPDTSCRVIELLDQNEAEAGACNLSTEGMCLVLEGRHVPGDRLGIEIRRTEQPNRFFALAEVKHALCCPSFREMWLTGCAFQVPMPGENVQDYV